MTTTALYKVLGKNADAIHGGSGTWHKPVGKRPGKWMDKLASVDCCTSGYHLVELYSLAEWLRGDCTIWLAEGRGATSSDGTGKTAFAQARLIRQLHISEQDLRLFAADCAEHVVHFYEAKYPNDDRPRKAIEATRAFARGEIGDAAGDAWAAAGTAGDAAGAAWAARDAAGAAAWDAAGAAAWAAAREQFKALVEKAFLCNS